MFLSIKTQLNAIVPYPAVSSYLCHLHSCTVPNLPSNTNIHTLHGPFRPLLKQCLQGTPSLISQS